MKIVLLGYMASGKSVVGKELAKQFNYEFIDLDAYIELKEESQYQLFFLKMVKFTLERKKRNI